MSTLNITGKESSYIENMLNATLISTGDGHDFIQNGHARNGGDGSDTFIYSSGGGKDVIYGFGNEDALQIVGTFTASLKGGDVSFKVGSTANAVTLKDYSATTFNVNGDTYAITNGAFTKK